MNRVSHPVFALTVLAFSLSSGCLGDAGIFDPTLYPDASDVADTSGDQDEPTPSDAADLAPSDADLEVDVEDDAGDLGDTAEEEVSPDDVTEVEPPDPEILRPSFNPDGDDFYRMPWPNDWRRQPDGHLDLSDFPRQSPVVLGRMIAVLENEVSGFATMPVVYIEFDQDLASTASLPEPAETLSPSSPVQLIDLSEDDCGERLPVIVSFDAVGNSYRSPNVLMATPVPGFPLVPDRTYGLILLRVFGDDGGQETAVPTRMADLLNGTDADPSLQAVYDPLLDCLPDTDVPASDIAVATVFTSQDPVWECRAVRNAVMDPARTAAPVITSLAYSADASKQGHYTSYVGTYDTPIYQRGTSPYATEGGGFVFDESNQPVIQRWEEVPFVVSLPHNYQEPLPIIIWSDGTGAGLFHHLNESPSTALFAENFAIVSFSPQFHGDRATPGSDPVLSSFNFLNPESGRTVFRQQVADTSYLIRVIHEAFPSEDLLPTFDTSRLVYGSHSQGSLVGALIAGVEPEIEAFALNGVGAYISATVEERKDPLDVAALMQLQLGVRDEIDVFHPVVQLIQTVSEPVDSHNYAREWRGWPGHPSGSHVYTTNGSNDHTTPRRAINNLTIVADLAPVDPPGWDVDPYDVWSRSPEATPIQGNRTALDGSPLTLATFLGVGTDHYTIYDSDEARNLAISFLTSALEGTPVLQ